MNSAGQLFSNDALDVARDRGSKRLQTFMRRVAWVSGLRLHGTDDGAEPQAAIRQISRKGISPLAAETLRQRGYGIVPGAEAPKGAAAIALYNGEAHFVVDAIGRAGVARSLQREYLEKGAGQVGLVLVTDTPLDGSNLEPGVRSVACRP